MRRLALVTGMLALSGCRMLRQAFSSHAEVAGTAAGQTLSVERLAGLVGRAPRIPVRPDVITGVAMAYLDYAVFATALARGRDLEDSTLALEAEWPVAAQLRWERFHAQLVKRRGLTTGANADSAYRAGTIRLFQHILIRVPPSAAPLIEEQQKQKAAGVLRQAQAGGGRGSSFAELARRYSEDPGSKARGGYLPATPRGQFVPAFDSAAWGLAPGAMSGLVRSPFGFHIIRRPLFTEVRDSFRIDVENVRTNHLDSIYVDSLTKALQLTVEGGAAARVRSTAPRGTGSRDDDRVLARSTAGLFRVKDLARWLLALDPNDVRGIATATDEQLTQLVKLLAQRDLLLAQADAAGVRLTPDDWRHLRTEHDSSVSRLEGLLALSPTLLRDSAATPDARARLAMAHLERYMDAAVTLGRVPFLPVPPFLAAALRRGEPWALNDAGIARALERASAIRAADTTLRAGPAPGLRPASGPPPVAPDSGAKPAPH
ncbi:MAG TPA: peptidylprolyl isomerase [Gemmatimonadales bacterium]|nr:peptidylprolyl isomerase [Gemmatimonadales bacterium]